MQSSYCGWLFKIFLDSLLFTKMILLTWKKEFSNKIDEETITHDLERATYPEAKQGEAPQEEEWDIETT